MSIIIPLLGLSFYSVVAGWSIDYIAKAAVNSFSQFSGSDSENAFEQMLASPLRLLLFHSLFIASAVFVVARGINKGIEVIAKFMMPSLFAILVILALNSIINADIKSGLEFLFNPDFSKLTPKVVFLALGQAFFSVAIGVGMLITYGAYVPKNVSLPKAAFTISLVDNVFMVMVIVMVINLIHP